MKINYTRLCLILIISVNLILRLPALFDPVSYGDECIYLALGHAFKQGLVFYRDIHDNKPPLLYLVAALAGANLFWFRLIMTVLNTINLWFIYKIILKILKKERAALLGSFLFLVFSFLPEGRIANGELFMIMPASLGLWLAWLAKEKKENKLWFLSGLSFSISFLFKVPVFLDFLGLLLAFFLFTPQKRVYKKFGKNDFRRLLKNRALFLILGGFGLPIIASIIYYSAKGAFTPYVRSALMQNLGYLSTWGGTNWGLIARGLILIFLVAWLYYWRRFLGFSFLLPSLLVTFGLYGVFLSQRPYPHYILQVAPWAAILLAVFFQQRKNKQLIIVLFLGLLTFGGIKKYKFWWYPHLPYYQNFLRFSLGRINQEEFFAFFHPKVLLDYQIARYLKVHTQAEDPVFIWGDGACIYALAKRLPPGRYTVNYHIYDFNGYQETLNALEKKPPEAVVLLESALPKFPELETLLDINYALAGQINGAKIYQKLGANGKH